jgi:hypothetical protein
MADNPRTVKCPKCSAPKHTACRRVRPGRKTEVQFLNDFHAERKIAAQNEPDSGIEETT